MLHAMGIRTSIILPITAIWIEKILSSKLCEAPLSSMEKKSKNVIKVPFQFCGTLLLFLSVLHSIQHDRLPGAFLPGHGETTDLLVERPTSGAASKAHDHHSLPWSPSLKGTPVEDTILTIKQFIYNKFVQLHPVVIFIRDEVSKWLVR